MQSKKSQLKFKSYKEKLLIYATQAWTACFIMLCIQGVLFLIVNKANIVEYTVTKDTDVFHQRSWRNYKLTNIFFNIIN